MTWFILNEERVDVDSINLGGNSRVLIMSSKSTRLNVNSILSDSSGQVFVAPFQFVSISTQLSPCLVAFNSSVVGFGNETGNDVAILRTVHVYGKLDLSNTPSVKIGRNGGAFVMYPGSSPNQLDFKNFEIVPTPGYQINLIQNEKTKVMNIDGGQFSIADGSSFNSTSQFTLLADDVIINGVMAAPMLTSSIWNSLFVGRHGSLNTSILTNVCQVNNVIVHGNLRINNPDMSVNVTSVIVSGTLTLGAVNLGGLTTPRATSINVASGGMFILNSQNSTRGSIVRVSIIQVHGTFFGGQINPVEGWNQVSVGSQGDLSLELTDELHIDTLNVSGSLEVANNVSIRGYTRDRVDRVLVNTGGSLILNSRKVGTSYLRIVQVEINGQFLAGEVSVVEGWDSLYIHAQGNMIIYVSGEMSLDHLEVSGSLEVINNVSIRGYRKNRTDRIVVNLGGSITLNSQKSGTSYLRISIVEINGQFLLGKASTVEGWERLLVKDQGNVEIEFASDFQVDRLEVSGNLQVNNSVNIQGFTENRMRDFVINSGGSVTLDAQKKSEISLIRAFNLSINGHFQAGTVSSGQGWSLFEVGSQGSMTIAFHDTLRVDSVVISGHLVVSNELMIRGYSDVKTLEFKTETGSSVTLMADNYNVSCGEKKTYSELHVLVLSIKGFFKAGPLSIVDGINNFIISNDGNFQFYPVGEFWFSLFTVNGRMTSFRDIIIEGRYRLPFLHAEFGPSSDVVLKRCFGNSRLIAQRVTVAGKLVTDLLTIGQNWKELTVTGTFEFLPADIFNITNTVINGTWKTLKPFNKDIPLIGNILVVNQGAIVSLNYQQELEYPANGSIPSTIRMAEFINIHGRIEAGSLNMFTDNLAISTGGVLTVDWGGYASGQGPGAGMPSSSGSSGASHGGKGGKGAGVLCHKAPYGSIYTRTTWGSGGGHAGKMGGRGGGIVYLEVQQRVQLDGIIRSSGEPGKVILFNCTISIFNISYSCLHIFKPGIK